MTVRDADDDVRKRSLPKLSAKLELFAKRDFAREIPVRVFRIERPPALSLVGPVVPAPVASRVEVEAVAARRAQLELLRFVDQLLS
jgi:hypothetical protein